MQHFPSFPRVKTGAAVTPIESGKQPEQNVYEWVHTAVERHREKSRGGKPWSFAFRLSIQKEIITMPNPLGSVTS